MGGGGGISYQRSSQISSSLSVATRHLDFIKGRFILIEPDSVQEPLVEVEISGTVRVGCTTLSSAAFEELMRLYKPKTSA